MQSRGVIRKMFEEDGELVISFPQHDGYFSAPISDTALCAKIREASASNREISFTFDKTLKILSIQ